MRNLLSIIMLFIGTISYGQTGLYEAIEQNGSEVQYREFYSVYKGDKVGTTKVSGEGSWVTAEVEKSASGEKIGFVLKDSDGKEYAGINVLHRYIELKGYPNVSYIYHEMNESGTIVVDDYIISLSGISADGLSFKSINNVYIKKQTEEKKETTNSDKPKKKSKFLAGLEKAALSAISSEPSEKISLEAKKAMSVDLYQIAKDYLKAMKAKQDAYTLTTKDNADITKMKALRKARYDGFKSVNDSIMATPEGQAMWGSKSNSNTSNYTIKNTSSSPITIGGNGWTYLLSSGSTKNISCNSSVYRMVKNGSSWETGSLISNGSNVCGKTISI